MFGVMTMSERRNIVGVRIREARHAERPRATQEDISARLAIIGVTLTNSSIGKIEAGTRAVTDLQLVAFSKVLRRSTSWLLGED